MGTRRKSSGWESFYTIADCAGTPDTTLIATTGGFPLGTFSSSALDLYDIAGAGVNLDAVKLEFIFSISHGTAGDAKTTVFELYASNGVSGPRQVVVSLALIGGTAQVAGAATLVWADSATATNYRGTGQTVVVNDHSANNVVSVTVPVLGLRFWEGLFTGGSSTGVACTAYYRWFTE